MGYLSENNTQVLTASEMANQLGITYNYFIKVIARIRDAGLIESIQGPVGGYRLAKPAADISLYDIIRIMEGDIHINAVWKKTDFAAEMPLKFARCIRFLKLSKVN